MNPSHKHVGPNGPGQIKNDITISDYIERKQNSFDRYPYMKHSTAEPISETPKKLSFDEWWDSGKLCKYNPYRPNSAAWWALEGWKAAQENA